MAPEGNPISNTAADKAAAQPSALPGPLALLTATALGGLLGSGVGGKRLAVAAGATVLAWLNLRRKTPGGPAAQPPAQTPAPASTPSAAPLPVQVPVPREPEVDPRIQAWLARQMDRDNRAEEAAAQIPPSPAGDSWPAAPLAAVPAFTAAPPSEPVSEPAPVVEAPPELATAEIEPDEAEDDYRPEPLLPDFPSGNAWAAEPYAALTEPAPLAALKPEPFPVPAPPPGMFAAAPAAAVPSPAPSAIVFPAAPIVDIPVVASAPVSFQEPPRLEIPPPHAAPVLFQEPPPAVFHAPAPPVSTSPLAPPPPPPVFPEPILLREPPKPVFSTSRSATASFPPPPMMAAGTSPLPGIEPLPSWNETADPVPEIPDPAAEVDLEALFNMPAFQGGILPSEIAVPPPAEVEEASATPTESEPEPGPPAASPEVEADPMGVFFQMPPPAAPPAEDATAGQTAPAPEIAVHVAAAGEAWFDSPLADVPNPWLPPQVDDEAFAPTSFTPPPPYAPPPAPVPVVEAEIVLRPRAPVQAAVVSKVTPPAKAPLIDQDAEPADGAQEALPQAPAQSPREQRARPSWRSWFRGD